MSDSDPGSDAAGDSRLVRILRDVAAFLFLPLIVAVVSIDVIGRYFFSHPFAWSQEIATLALLLLFVAAIPCTTAANGHVRTETFYEHRSSRARAFIDAVGASCGALFMGVVAVWQCLELPGLYARGEGAEFVDIPYWPISLLLALCMVYGCLQLLRRALGAWRQAMARRSGP